MVMTGLKTFVIAIFGYGVVADHIGKFKKQKKALKYPKKQKQPPFLHSLCAASLSTIGATWGDRDNTDVPISGKLVVNCQSQAKMKGKDTVLVTGGSGFLGQHIVKLLQEKCEDVGEIRVFDLKPYENKLGHQCKKPVQSYVGDLSKASDVNEALKGVDAVIHTAGIVSFGTFPDMEGMEKVNVEGTCNLIEGCVAQNVPRLVFTSTIDVVIGYEEIINGNESLPVPKKFLFPGYPDTKSRAEKMIISANGMELSKGDGSRLHTMALRPNVMYGEGDPYFIPNALKAASANCGVLPRIGNGKALFQQAYVGNMAWAHVKAIQSLKDNPQASSGRAYFITDDTPLCNSFEFMDNFLRPMGFKLSKFSIPYPIVYGMMYVVELFLTLLSPFYKINIDTALCSIIYINKTYYFSRKMAEKTIDYKPLYTYEESLENSVPYYIGMEL